MAWSLPRGFLEHQPPAGLAWTGACGERINSLPSAQQLLLMLVMAAWGPPPGTQISWRWAPGSTPLGPGS